MRRTVKDVEFYIDRLNTVLNELNQPYYYVLGKRYGYKAIDRYRYGDNVLVETVRSGLTTGQAYDIAYSLYTLAVNLK